MKIYTLIENTPYTQGFRCEHGLSLYIETENRKILFDTGQSGDFADNATELGVKLEDVDMLILSHGHYDHGGGIKRFLEINKRAPVYLSKWAFGDHYNVTDDYIGLAKELVECDRIIYVDDFMEIEENLHIFGADRIEMKRPGDSAGLKIKVNNQMYPDTFRHEQYLMIHENGKRILISGCSHNGILNIMNKFKPDIMVGGFHFMKKEITASGNSEVWNAAEELMRYDTCYYTCHCTGIEQFEYMKKIMGERLFYLSAGQKIEV